MDPEKNKKKFWLGVALIVGSSIGGWISLFIGGIGSFSEFLKSQGSGSILKAILGNIYIQLWLLSWPIFFLGIALAGPKGLEMFKKFKNQLVQKAMLLFKREKRQ